jgi:sugar phosphate isomerase/epimerase
VTAYAATQCLAGVESVGDALEAYARLGIDHVELSGPHDRPSSPELLDALARMPFEFVVHNYFPAPDEPFVLNLASADGAVRQRGIDHVVDNLELCARIGSPLYTVHGGFRCDPGTDFVFHPERGMTGAELAMDLFADSIAQACRRAEQLGIDIGVENNVLSPANDAKSPGDPFLLFLTASDYEQLAARVSSPRLGALLDVGHLNVTCHTLGLDRSAVVAEMLPFASALHLHDNDGSADQHLPVTPASWFMPHLSGEVGRRMILEPQGLSETELRECIDLVDDAVRAATPVRSGE